MEETTSLYDCVTVISSPTEVSALVCDKALVLHRLVLNGQFVSDPRRRLLRGRNTVAKHDVAFNSAFRRWMESCWC